MNVFGRIDLPLLLAAAGFLLVGTMGCVTPTVTAAPIAPKVEDDEHLYCMCVASCGDGPPALIDMPLDACRNPPQGCKALPIFCEKEVVERVEQQQQQQLRHPSEYESSVPKPRVYEL